MKSKITDKKRKIQSKKMEKCLIAFVSVITSFKLDNNYYLS